MTPRDEEIARLIEGARHLPRSRWDEYLHAETRDDEIRREARELLHAYARKGQFLEQPAWQVAPELVLDVSQPSLTGQRIGNYRVLDEIGRGGMGVVYAARDERLGRTVALKALPPEYTQDTKRRERLVREAQAAGALLHPSIATVFALEEIDGALYIASELVRGRTLRDELRDGPFPASQLLDVLIAIAEGLVAAHQQGIVHRDLKPENVVRREDGRIKILDFGIARIAAGDTPTSTTPLTVDGMALGTPAYMAPEQFTGGEIDARVDQYAFGVMAFELATGEHPFGHDPVPGRNTWASRTLPIAGLDRIVRRATRASPAERYATTEALLADLRAVDPSARAGPAPDGDGALWWWQFHQVAISIVNAAMPVAMWAIRPWLPRFGSLLFLVALTAATVSVTLRLHLFFTARVHPGMLIEQRERSFTGIAAADGGLALLLLIVTGLIAGNHDGVSALLLSVAIVILASLGLIEPATTKAAGLKT